MLAGPVLVAPVLADPVLAGPVLADPVLVGPVLADPVLAGPVLADPVLDGAVPDGALCWTGAPPRPPLAGAGALKLVLRAADDPPGISMDSPAKIMLASASLEFAASTAARLTPWLAAIPERVSPG